MVIDIFAQSHKFLYVFLLHCRRAGDDIALGSVGAAHQKKQCKQIVIYGDFFKWFGAEIFVNALCNKVTARLVYRRIDFWRHNQDRLDQ